MTQDSDTLAVGDTYYNTRTNALFVLISRSPIADFAKFVVLGGPLHCQTIDVGQNWLSHHQWSKNKSCVRL